MFKAMILLTRRADLTHEAWTRWWLDEHAPLAAQLPGVRRAVFNVVEAGAAGAGIDGVSELWFDDQAAFEAAYASGIGATVAADSLAHVSGRVRVFVTEHDLGVSGPPD